MATKSARGTKRTCQNEECGSRFYDLNRSPIICPICQEEYAIASAPMVEPEPAPVVDEKLARAKAKKPAEFVDAEEEKPAPEGEEALADIEAVEEPIAAEEDATFLEEEEEGGDVSGIIGEVPEGEEEV
jgi:uncharacterized protein (TIGR02300 family)